MKPGCPWRHVRLSSNELATIVGNDVYDAGHQLPHGTEHFCTEPNHETSSLDDKVAILLIHWSIPSPSTVPTLTEQQWQGQVFDNTILECDPLR
jgi:hypothetical protein